MPYPPLQPQLYISTQILKELCDKIKTGIETTFSEVILGREGKTKEIPPPPGTLGLTYCYLPLVCFPSFVVEI